MLYQNKNAIPSVMRDFPEWHLGRKNYAVWILRCDKSSAVQEKFAAARAHLSDYLIESYARQPHITLSVCGFWADEPKYNDDFTREQLEAQTRFLREADIKPFEIEIGGINSFASAPFLEVDDPEEGINRLRKAMLGGVCEFRTAPYMPHLTIGLYSAAFPSKEILSRMEEFSYKPVRYRVEEVTLATYRAKEIAGELTCISDYSLNSKSAEL